MSFVMSLSKESLTGIAPASLAAFARASGWRISGTYRRCADVYSGDGLPDIIVPRVHDIADYAMAVSDVIAAFAARSGRSEASVYQDLFYADRDVIRVGRPGDDGGGLPFRYGLALMNWCWGMMVEAAWSLDAEDGYLEGVLMAQGEPGWTGFLLASPVIGAGAADAPPLVRRVTIRFCRLLAAVAAGETGAGDSFGEALVALLDDAGPFQVSVSYALMWPVDGGPVRFEFDRSHADFLRRVASGGDCDVMGARLPEGLRPRL